MRIKMMTENNSSVHEARIHDLVEARAQAVRDKDVVALMSQYAPDVLQFDAIETMQNVGAEGVQKRAEAWFAGYPEGIGYETHDLSITAGEDIAFCHHLNHIVGTLTDGTEVNMWVRATVCYRKIDGNWRITHEHTSAPITP